MLRFYIFKANQTKIINKVCKRITYNKNRLLSMDGKLILPIRDIIDIQVCCINYRKIFSSVDLRV